MDDPRLTEADLAELDLLIEQGYDAIGLPDGEVPRLVAEVRRVRAIVRPALAEAEEREAGAMEGTSPEYIRWLRSLLGE